ncbi:FAD-dependent oxidoreductase [Clostridium sp. BJN0001]|uniref:FAD-dependent oxidoreductase n=1 Tax=Clostridium sp. BJN0001 TaxID=2930219 RepID=UPI001FD5A102|nr:FAD-dependent oxidoreductase [Clostridium sp. BJN0001]
MQESIFYKESFLQCEKILVAIGRKLNSDSEAFINLGLAIENGSIVVNKNMETNINGVYAAGDVIGGKLLAHLSFIEESSTEPLMKLENTEVWMQVLLHHLPMMAGKL